MQHDDVKLERVERVLREHGPAELSAQFRAGVLDAVQALPPAELLAPATAPRQAVLVAIAAVLLLLGTLALVMPTGSGWLAAWQLELSDLSLALTVGESVLTASLLSIVALLLGAGFMTCIGIYGVKHRLISA